MGNHNKSFTVLQSITLAFGGSLVTSITTTLKDKASFSTLSELIESVQAALGGNTLSVIIIATVILAPLFYFFPGLTSKLVPLLLLGIISLLLLPTLTDLLSAGNPAGGLLFIAIVFFLGASATGLLLATSS